MHELSLAVEIVQIVETAIAQNNLQVVDRLRLTVGELASVEKPAMDLALSTALAGTLAENAAIEYIDEPGQGICQACGATVAVHQYHEPCEACGGFPVRITQGQALKVKAIEGY